MNSVIYRNLFKAALLSGAIFTGWAAHAQSSTTDNMSADSSSHKSMHRQWGHRHGPRIHYTPEQRKQAMAINMDYRKKSSDLFQKDNITLKEYKASLVALQKEKKSKLEALLTQEQKDQLAARKKRAAENAQVMAAARMERLKIKLNLSDDQVAKLKSGQEDLRAQMLSIHENQDLLPQQKMEQLKDLAAKRQDTFKAVLTPEQLSKFQELSHRRDGAK